MWKSIKNFILGILVNPAIAEGEKLAEDALRKMAAKNPKLFKVLVVSAHTAAKEYGQELVASTATDLDDKALTAFVEAMEVVADENGIDLDYEAEKLKEPV